MTDVKLDLPALYVSADSAAAEAQRTFWWTIRFEYALLFLVTVLSATRSMAAFNSTLISIILVVLAGLFVFRVYKKLDQDWYRCRALAESVKTSTWRFAMRAHPFQDASRIDQPKAEFRNLLRAILSANQSLAANLYAAEANQVTPSMLQIRKLTLSERKEYYTAKRIDDQRLWYARKSKENKKALKFWILTTIVVYIIAFSIVSLDQIGFRWIYFGFDPMIVIVTSAIGWMQMKRHSELTASYNLTAHEIGIIRENSDSIESEEAFSDFVNEAELAFSREHTQWVARRDAV